MGNLWQKSYIDVHEATQSGHIDEVRRWVDAGKPVDARDNTQKTPLHHAAQWGQEEALDFLIECGADVNAADFIEDTPLHLACYFGHANCARILIMVGADIGAKDCYGNTPSQIFDDHVTEPVLDEIRFIVREVTKGPCPAQEPEHETSESASARNREISNGSPFHDSINSAAAPRGPPSTLRNDSGLPLHGCGSLESDNAVSAEGAVAKVVAAEKKASTSPSNDKLEVAACVPRAALGEVKRSEPSDSGESLVLKLAQEGKGDRSPTRAADTSSVGSSVQQQPQEAGQEGAPGHFVGGGVTREANAAAGERQAGTRPSGATAGAGEGLPETGGLAPRLKLSLPWDDEGGPGLASIQELGGGSEKSPAAASIGGGLSARTVGEGGSAAVGLTYPGPRPLSAPQMRRSLGASPLNATGPILSGRRFEGTTVSKDRGLEGSRSLGRTAGASLAGRLMSYATRPGGTFDVFAAARDGQVSVLKQALTEGEEVDVQDEAGLTALMWAARAGRLSTAKYLVSQGASLERRDEATGFSPLHFAAYYCRSSVVRVLVLAGADTKATDNRGRVPGASFQSLSYLSYEAFHHRRLIRRFLAGDLNDGMDGKGKTMFPMNSPLEAYDEEHRPQCVRLGSRDNLTAHSDHSSAEEGFLGSSRGSGSAATHHPRTSRSRSRSPPQPRPYPGTSHRRASAEIARKAYATMHTMHSRVDDDSSPRKKSMSEATGGGARGSGGGGGGGGGGVRYYLRRGSMQQVAAKTRKILAGTTGSGSDDEDRDRAQTSSSPKCGHSSPRRGGGGRAEGGVNFYLRRPSLQGLPIIEKLLSGGGAKGDEGGDAAAGDLGAGGASSAYDGRKGEGTGGDGDNEVSSTARDMAAAVASFEAAAAAAAAAGAESRNVSDGNGDCANCLEEQSVLGRVEAGRGIQGSRGVGEVVRGDELARRDREEEGEEGGGGGGGGRIKRVSAKLFEGMRDGARDLAAQVQGEREPSSNRRPSHDSARGDRSSMYESADVESGTRTTPPPQGEASPVTSYPGGLEQGGTHPQRSQRCQPRESTGAPTAVAREHLQNGVAANLVYGDTCSDAPSLAESHLGRDASGTAGSVEGTNEGSNPATTEEALAPSESTSDRKPAAAELDSPSAGDGDHVGLEDNGRAASALGPPRAAGGGSGAGDIVSAVNATGDPTSRPERSGTTAVGAVEAARGVGIDAISSAEQQSRPEKRLAAAEESQQGQGPRDLEEGVSVQGADRMAAHPQQPNRQPVSSSTGLDAEASGDEAVAVAASAAAEPTPFDGSSNVDPQSREPTDAFSTRSVVSSSVGEGKDDGGTDVCTDAEPILSGEESASKRHGSGRSDGRSGGGRKSHKRKHKRSHHRHHRDKGSDEGGVSGKSRRRRSRDHGLLGSAGGPTITALAPLKRIPPPSSSLAQRATHHGDGPAGEAPSGGDGGGGGGDGGG